MPPTATVALESKSREAQEFRAQAKTLETELLDLSKPLTQDEVKTKSDAIAALYSRASVVAKFTGKDELARQGEEDDDTLTDKRGDKTVVRIDGEGNVKSRDGRRTAGDAKSTGMSRAIADFAETVKAEFGDVRSFLQMATGRPGMKPTEKQRKVFDDCATLTRAIVGTAGDASGGEFVLPLTQVQSIFSLANVQQGLLQRARAYNVPGRTLRIPYLIQTDESATSTLNRPMAGQIAEVAIVGEGATAATREPKFGQRLLTIFKYGALSQVGDETLGDDFTGELPQEFINAVGQQALNKVNQDITVSGVGTTEPTGAILAGGAHTIAVTRAGGLGTATLATADVFKMYDRHTHGPGSFWLASRRLLEGLYGLSLTASSLVTFLRTLNSVPEGYLLGYPIVLSDLPSTYGGVGDLSLINPDFYAFALRQALTVQSSADFAFSQFLTTYRFMLRAGGIPINTGPYAYRYSGVTSAGVDEHSPFVYLQ